MTTNWRTEAKRMLSEGYGVEDIAVSMRIELEPVRQLVRAMRNSGMLADVCGITLDRIVAGVAYESGISVSEILGPNRQRKYVIPRHEVMRRAYALGFDTGKIGRHMGRDHTTVLNGIRRAKERKLTQRNTRQA